MILFIVKEKLLSKKNVYIYAILVKYYNLICIIECKCIRFMHINIYYI
jgi:hypothetical protein